MKVAFLIGAVRLVACQVAVLSPSEGVKKPAEGTLTGGGEEPAGGTGSLIGNPSSMKSISTGSPSAVPSTFLGTPPGASLAGAAG